MKPTVIHHSADYDGIFCREIARKFLPDAELIGWDYGDPKITLSGGGVVYILDLSPDCVEQPTPERIIWIDHHNSAIKKWGTLYPGYQIDGVAACRLTWQWFTAKHDSDIHLEDFEFPHKQDFINRTVSEPLAVRLAGEYDIWDHRDDNADVAFQFGLDAQEALNWSHLLREDGSGNESAHGIIYDGRAAMRCYAKRDADVMRTRSFITEFEGLKFLSLTTARCNSNTFAARDVPETGHDGLLAFYWTGKDWSVSMYHAAHRRELDLSQIAVKYGGGGHRGACGFRADKLPFLS